LDAAVGLNVTLTEQLAPAARLVPQVVVLVKSPELAPEMEMLTIVRVPIPTLDRMTVCGALEVLIAWFPNDSEEGFSETTGTAVLLKLPTVTFPPFTVTLRLAGVKLYPELLGVTVYVPLPSPENE
jgi:hypothetical protein